MPTKWIDFRALKAQVPIRDVLARYGYLDGLKDRGNGRLSGSCPIHGGKSGNSFHVDTEKNVFHCFSECGGGNVLDLVMKVEQCDIRQAAEKLAGWFGLTFERSEADKRPARSVGVHRENARPKTVTESRSEADSADLGRKADDAGAVINPPMAGPLKSLNQDHEYLWRRGLTIQTVKTFSVGYCSRGLMKGRIAIPIHNEDGELVAYAGRAVDDELARKDGKYKLPSGFHKSHVIYNLYRAKEYADRGLIVVEGFFDAMKVTQAGFPNVVALMGASLSEPQEQLLVAATDRLVLMFDGDDAGAKCVREFYGKLRRKLFLKEVPLEDGEQPDGLTEERLKSLLS
jgi:DNA primase